MCCLQASAAVRPHLLRTWKGGVREPHYLETANPKYFNPIRLLEVP